MVRVLVTGMSGVGKSSLLRELARRGHRTVDTDHDGWTLPTGLWDGPRMHQLLTSADSVVVSGTVDNQGSFYGWFDHVVLLTAPLQVLLERLALRTDNPYGKTLAQQAEVSHFHTTVQPLLRAGATSELDGTSPVSDLADAVEQLGGQP